MTNLTIETLQTSSLNPYANNARTHSKKQIRQIANSITEFGFTNPVLIDEDLNILAGHGRVLAAKELGMKEVPCVRLEHMTPVQKKAYILADNKLALNAGWDEELLGQELESLMSLDIDFDLSLTGFSIPEVDLLIESISVEEPNDPEDDILPFTDETLQKCYLGDIWQLGSHRLICGDALDAEVVTRLMDGATADMVFTDPPYNVKIDGNVCGKGDIKHKEFDMASGEMSPQEFTRFLQTAFENQIAHSRNGSIHFSCMDWRHMGEILAAGKVYTELKNLITWVKDNGGMGTFYRSRHELIFAFKNGTAPHTNTFELGQHGRYRTNVWEYKGVNSFGSDRLKKLTMHPTVKPVQMIADAIKDVSARGDIVLDIFAGSGSTLIAAHKTGRRGYLAEIDPDYCSAIIKRWESYANDESVLLHRVENSTGEEDCITQTEDELIPEGV